MVKLVGYRLGKKDEKYPSFSSYLRNSKDVFLLCELAHLSSKEIYFHLSLDGKYVVVSFYPNGLDQYPANASNVIPYVQVDLDSWSTVTIEQTGFADGFEQYLSLVVDAWSGTKFKCGNEKMFPNISKEQLLITADMNFDQVEEDDVGNGKCAL